MKATVLYDADCGFCRTMLAGILAWDRKETLRPVAIGSDEGGQLLADLSEDERNASWHLVEPDGGRESAGAAVAPLFSRLPAGAPVAAIARAAPDVTAATYRWVARNRTPLGSRIPDRVKATADRRIEKRADSANP